MHITITYTNLKWKQSDYKLKKYYNVKSSSDHFLLEEFKEFLLRFLDFWDLVKSEISSETQEDKD